MNQKVEVRIKVFAPLIWEEEYREHIYHVFRRMIQDIRAK